MPGFKKNIQDIHFFNTAKNGTNENPSLCLQSTKMK